MSFRKARGLAIALESELQVHCYAGHRAEQTPRRFTLGGRQVEVAEVVDTWLEPDHRYFKVTGDDGSDYLLRHDVRGGIWQLIEFPTGQL